MIISSKHYLKHNYFFSFFTLVKLTVRKLFFGRQKFWQGSLKDKSILVHQNIKNGYPVLELLDSKTLKCISCDLCVLNCPTSCIEIIKNKSMQMSPSLNFGNPPDDFRINLRSCIQCSLCEEVCPALAITISGEYDILDESVILWDKDILSTQSKPPTEDF